MKVAQGVGSFSMGLSAGGNAYGQAVKEGYDEGQARNYGLLVGASEATLQTLIGGIGDLGGVSTSKLLGKASMIDNALLRVSAKLGISVVDEITEEELQLCLEPAFKSIIFAFTYQSFTIFSFFHYSATSFLSSLIYHIAFFLVCKRITSAIEKKNQGFIAIFRKDCYNRLKTIIGVVMMKKTVSLTAAAAMCFSLTGCTGGKGLGSMVLIILGVILMLFSGLRTVNMIQYNKRRRRRKPIPGDQIIATGLLFMIAFLLVFIGILMMIPTGSAPKAAVPQEQTQQQESQTTPSESPASLFRPTKTSDSDPSNWGINWEIFQNGSKVTGYNRTNPIYFGDPADYFALPGIATFRGNNYRNSTNYGTANVESETLTTAWTTQTSTLPGSSWSGSGWTGQPLIVKWDEGTRDIMNLLPEKKNKDGLVEVIYATLDGHIYFLDLEDGSYTREPINVGMCFKGAGALDPRGYPLMYVGSGDENASGKRPRMYIISLIDGTILYEYGYEEDLSIRTDNDDWCAFDSSPLVHANTDTLIWPGESGILYTMKLNTVYDKSGGNITISPDNLVVTRYDTSRSGSDSYWYGYEASVVIVENYLYVSENGGMFYCVDLNTMELVWAQDTKDDSNCTPVFERVSETEAYIYTAPSLHWTRSDNMDGTISLYKLDAITGEIVWEVPYDVHTIDGVSGGVQSTPLLGKPGTALEGLIIFTVARTPDVYTGVMVALDTKTGEKVWTLDMNNYAWSSPVAIYEDDGNAYVLVCDSGGYAMLVDAEGSLLYTIGLGGNVEATPAVYEDMIVVGTRTQTINGIKIQ